jgi:hypothetical protein
MPMLYILPVSDKTVLGGGKPHDAPVENLVDRNCARVLISGIYYQRNGATRYGAGLSDDQLETESFR